MSKFSDESMKQLASCDSRLQIVMKEALNYMDFAVLCGARSNEEQEAAYKAGNSKLPPGKSKHNIFPSMAVDIAPTPIDFEYLPAFYVLAGIVLTIGTKLGISIRWGGNWSRNLNDIKLNTFNDLGHFELVD